MIMSFTLAHSCWGLAHHPDMAMVSPCAGNGSSSLQSTLAAAAVAEPRHRECPTQLSDIFRSFAARLPADALRRLIAGTDAFAQEHHSTLRVGTA